MTVSLTTVIAGVLAAFLIGLAVGFRVTKHWMNRESE